MYNKLFQKILDSSIWLAPDPHRLVFVTLIAAMDEHSIAHFACAENLAARARVSLEDTEAALASFQAPDAHDPDQEYEGRRIERVPGGWFLLNGDKYRLTVTRNSMLEQNRARVARFRARQKAANGTGDTAGSDPEDEPESCNVTVMHHNHNHNHSEGEAPQSVAPAKVPRGTTKRGTRFDETSELSADGRAYAVKLGLDPDRTFEKFKNYWVAKPGANACKLDWKRTWQNWCITEAERLPGHVVNGRPSEAITAWGAILAESPRTPRMQKALQEIGGWDVVRQRTPFNADKLRRDFCSAFDRLQPFDLKPT